MPFHSTLLWLRTITPTQAAGLNEYHDKKQNQSYPESFHRMGSCARKAPATVGTEGTWQHVRRPGVLKPPYSVGTPSRENRWQVATPPYTPRGPHPESVRGSLINSSIGLDRTTKHGVFLCWLSPN